MSGDAVLGRAACSAAIVARYWLTLVFSVFPAPDSPLEASLSMRRHFTQARAAYVISID